MSKNIPLWIFLSFLLLFAAGCKCDSLEIQTFDVLLDSPANGELISSLIPTFGWHDNESCDPDHYTISVNENGTFGFSPYEATSGNVSTHTWGTALLPGKEYSWHMRAHVSGGSSSDSESSLFYTGPVCTSEVLLAPNLQIPMDAGWVSHHKPQEFNWTYPGDCLPPNYDYEFSYDPGFSIVVNSGTTPLYEQHLFETFPNCSTLFWRVRARNGTEVGPWSDVFDFHWVRDTSCWQLHWPSLNSALIRGVIWYDDCPITNWFIPLDPNYVLNPKCQMAAGIGIVGNGIREPGEQRIDDVQVDLGSGPCPSTGLDSYHAPWGIYEFYVLSPGTYCVSVSKQQIADGTDLNGGVWTETLTENIVTEKTIIVPPGQSTVVKDFGWDDHEQPFVLQFLDVNTNCRFCPDPEGLIAKIPNAGEFIPLLAQVKDSDWKVASVEGVKCYLYDVNKYPGLPTEDDPDPCPPKEKEPKPDKPDPCEKYITYNDCVSHPRCEWDRISRTCKTK